MHLSGNQWLPPSVSINTESKNHGLRTVIKKTSIFCMGHSSHQDLGDLDLDDLRLGSTFLCLGRVLGEVVGDLEVVTFDLAELIPVMILGSGREEGGSPCCNQEETMLI